jgi:hypothetical protein
MVMRILENLEFLNGLPVERDILDDEGEESEEEEEEEEVTDPPQRETDADQSNSSRINIMDSQRLQESNGLN